MEELKPHELQKLINVCFEAVNKSNVGPVFLHVDGELKYDTNNARICEPLAYHTFLYLVSSLCPKNNPTSFKFDIPEKVQNG